MLHLKLARALTKEHHARRSLNDFCNFGASIHRRGRSTEFDLIIPVKRIDKRHSLMKVLERNSLGERFELINVTSFEGGLQYEPITEEQLSDPKVRAHVSAEATMPADSEADHPANLRGDIVPNYLRDAG